MINAFKILRQVSPRATNSHSIQHTFYCQAQTNALRLRSAALKPD